MGETQNELFESKIIGDIEYHKYAALIVHMDIDRYFPNRKEPDIAHIPDANEDFTEICTDYLEGLQDYEKDYLRANGFENHSSRFDNFLYRPACFISFGHTDNLAITAMDDLNPAFRLPSSWKVPVHQSCLAFCPTLKSIGLEKVKKENGKWEGHFCELSDICTPSDKKTLNDKQLFRFQFLEDRPLIAVTYYKMHGMSILGPGLLIQQAAFKAMGEIINRKLKYLKENYSKFKDLMSIDDIESFCCAFLDPQDWSDIATIMVCRNYSLMTTMVTALCSLTFAQLYDIEPRLIEAIEYFDIHQKMEDKYFENNDSNIPFSKNHIFWSTYTTLGLTYEAFTEGEQTERNDSPYSYNGAVIADTKLNVHSGHCFSSLETSQSHYWPEPLKKQFSVDKPHEIVWQIVGYDDFIYEQLIKSKDDFEADQAVKLCDLIKQIKDIFNYKSANKLQYLYHVTEARTDLRIPTILFGDTKDIEEHLDISSVLLNIREVLFEYIKCDDIREKREGLLNINNLKRNIRKLRLPDPLSRSFINLYNDFSRYLSDPYLFDSVIDLLDSFISTHHLLTESLPKKLISEAKTDSDCRCFIIDEDIAFLADIVEFMQDALALRVQFTFRDAERYDTSINVKGNGLVKILNTVDTSLKCMLRVLRRVMNNSKVDISNGKIDNQIDIKHKFKIGGASIISSHLRSFSKRITIKSDPNFYMTSVYLNVAHLGRPSALCIHLHEVAHLIGDLVEDEKIYSYNYRQSSRYRRLNQIEIIDFEREIRERHEDIFAEMLILKYVFEKDTKTYFKTLLVNYSFDPVSYHQDKGLKFLRMLEILIRGFFITDPIEQEGFYSSNEVSINKFNEIVSGAQDRFWKVVDEVGPFYTEFHLLWHKDDNKFRKYVNEQLKNAFEDSFNTICNIWEVVKQIYNDTCFGGEHLKVEQDRNGTDLREETLKDLGLDNGSIEDVKNCFKRGRPLIRALYDIPGVESNSEVERFINPFFLLRKLLKEYITGLYDNLDISKVNICLNRNVEDGFPNFNLKESRLGKESKWHTQLIDRNFNGLFSADADTRGEYIQRRIVFIKSLWDISTNLRARRMRDILTEYICWKGLT